MIGFACHMTVDRMQILNVAAEFLLIKGSSFSTVAQALSQYQSRKTFFKKSHFIGISGK